MPESAQLMELSALYRNLVKRMTQEWNKRMVDKLTMVQFRMLYILNAKGPQKATELAEALHVTSGAVTGMADKMIDLGYVERNRDDKDRRVVFLRIAEKGTAVVDVMLEYQIEIMSEFFGVLPEDDIQHLKRIFTKLLSQRDNKEKE